MERRKRRMEEVEGERRSTTTLGNQPPPSATPFSFSFRIVYRGMEDGKPATVRELTTFFRFSRGGECAGGAVGVADEWKKWEEEGRSRSRATPPRARERGDTDEGTAAGNDVPR